MSNHSFIRPWLSRLSESRSRFAYLSIISNMLAKIGVTADWRQRHSVCLSVEDTKESCMWSNHWLEIRKHLKSTHKVPIFQNVHSEILRSTTGIEYPKQITWSFSSCFIFIIYTFSSHPAKMSLPQSSPLLQSLAFLGLSAHPLLRRAHHYFSLCDTLCQSTQQHLLKVSFNIVEIHQKQDRNATRLIECICSNQSQMFL